MNIHVRQANWQKDKAQLKKLRQRVYVFEWQIPEAVEFDQQDNKADHILVHEADAKTAIATARLTHDGEIGRIAVQRPYRQPFVYKKIIETLLNMAREKRMKTVRIKCQLDAIEDYKNFGFKAVSPAFMEAGIPRQTLECPIKQFKLNHVKHTH